jgi:hypothetical protein
MKTCPDCGKTKDLNEFPPAKKRSDGRGTYCRDCMRLRSVASYRSRKEAQGKQVREARIAPSGQRWCPDCSAFKPEADFPRNRSSKTGYGGYCKPCHNVRTRKNLSKNHGSTREFHLRRRYGIGQAEVDEMLAAQSGKCAICCRPNPGHVDHDHATGKVRGLLCFNCNQALGNARDDVNVLYRAALYLMGHSDRHRPASPVEFATFGELIELEPGAWRHQATA